jgi:hypothetical protein
MYWQEDMFKYFYVYNVLARNYVFQLYVRKEIKPQVVSILGKEIQPLVVSVLRKKIQRRVIYLTLAHPF